MSISVTYDAAIFASYTVDQYLSEWATGFVTAGHGTTNTGGFNNGGFNGSQYATQGTNNSDYAFIAGSDTTNGLHYVFNPALPASSNQNHYLYGSLDSVSLGYDLTGGSGTNFALGGDVVTFSGLDLDAALGAGRTGNDVHQVIFGLMQGNTSALESVLDTLLGTIGESTSSTFAEISEAIAAHAASAVGVQSQVDDLALAA